MTSFMEVALEEARAAGRSGEVPIGCVVVHAGAVVARAGNRTLADRDPTAHAEIIAIRAAAGALGSERLTECDLYVTLEPCAMCAAAISFARIRRLYYGAADPKGGAVENGGRFFASPTCHHRRGRGRIAPEGILSNQEMTPAREAGSLILSASGRRGRPCGCETLHRQQR